MTTAVSKYVPIDILAGVCPPTDSTKSATKHFTAADKIRFVKGRPQKLGGWSKVTLNGTALQGAVRSVYSTIIADRVYTMLGSSWGLYTLLGSDLTNITPIDTATTVAAANSLATHHATLASAPLSTTDGSDSVVVADSEAALLKPGDLVTLSGATATAGIPTGDLNKQHIIRAVGTGNFTIKTATAANATTTGGGSSVVRRSGLLTLTKVAHGLTDGMRIKVAAASATGGIATGSINVEHVIRNVATDTFDFLTGGVATSSVSAGGGASTTYQKQLAPGLVDLTSGQGYGMGKYGVGLYGTALLSDDAKRMPRIWIFDSFGDAIIATAGSQTGIYTWDGSILAAPTLVPNAPTQVNYAFISDNTLVSLGAGGVENKIFASNQDDIENWTSSSTNSVFEDNIEGAGKFISHANVEGTNLLYTFNQCYTFRRIDGPAIWEILFKDNIGIIGPMARVVVKGKAYWMGPDNFYSWDGGAIEVMPSNSSSETTLLKYVFENINKAQQIKSFAWYNHKFDEIWFHYPSEGSNEVDRVARFHVTDRHWTPDTFNRLAAEYPTVNLQYPRLVDSSGNLYRHEVGLDDDTNAMAWSLTSNRRYLGTENALTVGVVPDSVQTGNISFKIDAFSFPQSAVAKNTKTVAITPSTEIVPLDVDGRFLEYTLTGQSLGQNWLMGDWLEPMQKSSRNQ